MSYIEMFTLSLALAMDAFSIAICKGLTLNRSNLKKAILVGIYFGVFQMIMPLTGYLLAARFSDKMQDIDHWVAFILLFYLGARMIVSNLRNKEEENLDTFATDKEALSIKQMLPLSIACSIDALAAGISFAMIKIDIFTVISMIGVTTFAFSVIGVKLGGFLGNKFRAYAELTGGIVLIIIGSRILLADLHSDATVFLLNSRL